MYPHLAYINYNTPNMNELKKIFDEYVSQFSQSFGMEKEAALNNMRNIMIERCGSESSTIDNVVVDLKTATYEQLRRLDNILYTTYNHSTGGRN